MVKVATEIASEIADPDIDVQGVGTVYLNIIHSCGHKGHLLFGSYEAAAAQKAQYQSWCCSDCLREERRKRPLIR